MKCKIRDIVTVNEFEYPQGGNGSLHRFVVMQVDDHNGYGLVPEDYFCFLVSSVTEKNNDVNPKFPYNEPIMKNADNRLSDDSHVKCDEVFEFEEEDIIQVIGSVYEEQFNKFLELFQKSIENDT